MIVKCQCNFTFSVHLDSVLQGRSDSPGGETAGIHKNGQNPMDGHGFSFA